jgi:hypothetical protein
MNISRLAIMRVLWAFVTCCAVDLANGQIFIDDFEDGTVGDDIIEGAGTWRAIGGVANAPKYRDADNPFPSGALYAELLDPDNLGNTRMISSDTDDTDGLEASIAAHVTTFSFNFFEPTADAHLADGMSIGYTTADDLNSGERAWRAFLRDGELAPNLVDEGAAVNYALDMVHTVFMLANDTANPVENYRDGQTLDPSEADVWISLAGADPVFAFSLTRQNPTLAPQGVGFRTFSGDTERLFVDNVLLVDGASFDRSVFTPAPLTGDYNGNGTVDAADYVLWRENVGQPGGTLPNDATGANPIGEAQYTQWKSNFGNPPGPGLGASLAAVPEPCSISLALLATAALGYCVRIRN